MTIIYAWETKFSAAEFADVLKRSTLSERRPADDLARLQVMIDHADLLVTARTEAGLLVGISRTISDLHFCTYLSDLAVDKEFQQQGIGKRLIQETHQRAGLQTNLVLLAAPAARSYYPHVGMLPHDSCWMIHGEA